MAIRIRKNENILNNTNQCQGVGKDCYKLIYGNLQYD